MIVVMCHMKLPVGQNKVMHWNEFVNLWGIYKYMIYRHTDLAQIAQKTGRLLLVRSSAPHLQNISWPHLPPTTSTAWPIPTNRPAILNNPSNPYTIGERDGPENIEQDYKGTRETCRPVVFSDCIRISGEIQDRCRVQNRPSADPKTRRIGAQAIGTKKDTPKRTRILPFREFAIRRNPFIHFLQLRAIVAGLLFCRNQNLGPADWTRRDCTTTTEAGF